MIIDLRVSSRDAALRTRFEAMVRDALTKLGHRIERGAIEYGAHIVVDELADGNVVAAVSVIRYQWLDNAPPVREVSGDMFRCGVEQGLHAMYPDLAVNELLGMVVRSLTQD